MLIGNIGLGLFILVIVWILALVLFVFGIKFQNNIAWISLGLTSFFTVILLIIPLQSSKEEESDELEKDYIYVYKTSILLFMILSALLSFICFFTFHCIEPLRPKVIKTF